MQSCEWDSIVIKESIRESLADGCLEIMENNALGCVLESVLRGVLAGVLEGVLEDVQY